MAEPHKLVLSVDLEEWYHSGRWLDGEQAARVPDTRALFRRLYSADRPAGEVIEPTRRLLDLFERHRCRCTFFVLGELAEWYPELIKEIADRGHEIACHGMHHVDMTVLGPEAFSEQIREARDLIYSITGRVCVGYRAPNLVFETWATSVLEAEGFVYDSSVCVSRSIGGKYKGWSQAPIHPYRPDYDNVARAGGASLVELPLPPFPVIRLSAGSGIMTRVLGYHWSAIALRHALRTGDTGYYFHPWEVGACPPVRGSALKSRLFHRHMGDWMLGTLDRLLTAFSGRTITALEAADRYLSTAVPAASQPSREALG
jgi:polysaccharide deacetylase family protein (PEP-CTERM system associated)